MLLPFGSDFFLGLILRHRKPLKLKYKNFSFVCCFLYGHEILSRTFREEYRMKSFENIVFSRVCGSNREKVTCYFLLVRLYCGENCIMTRFMICIFPPDIVRTVKSRNGANSNCGGGQKYSQVFGKEIS